MSRAVVRSILIAMGTMLTIGAAHLVYATGFCQGHRRWVRVMEQHDPVIRDDGYLFARTGDAIYACTSPDRIGSIVTLHEDLDCYCASAADGAEAASRLIGGQCTVDQIAPTRGDETGACRHAHCAQHLGP
jgi:hypothetical protein